MKTFFVILEDSIRESIDRRSLIILLFLSIVAIVFCLGISYQSENPETLLARNFSQLDRLEYTRSAGLSSFNMSNSIGFEAEIDGIRPVTPEDGFPKDVAHGYRIDLTTTQSHLNGLVRGWRSFQEDIERHGLDDDEQEEVEVPTTYPPEDWQQALRERIAHDLFPHVHVGKAQIGAENEVKIATAVAVNDWADIPGAHKQSLFFGLVEQKVIDTSLSEAVVNMQRVLANTFGGFIGILIALGVCSSFVPSMLQKGTLDLVLARPVGRVPLLLWKYLGGLSFIFVFGSFLIGGCWVALGLRTGYWDPMFLLSVGVLMLGFSFLYAVSVTVGVWSRSTNMAFMVSVGVWGISSSATGLYRSRDVLLKSSPEWVKTLIEVLYTILPKITDLDTLNTWLFSKATLDPMAYDRIMKELPEVDWFFSLGTSFAFAAVVLALGCRLFYKRDY